MPPETDGPGPEAKAQPDASSTNKRLSQTPSAPANNLYTIEPVPGKGLGVVAAQRIPRGTRIMEDTPLFIVPVAVTNLAVMKQIIAAGLKNATKDQQREFLALPNAHPQNGPLVGTASTNMHPMGGASASEAGMFLLACRMNHSCDHNAQNTWNTRRKRMTVHACRDIEKGEEVNLRYLSGVLGYEERQQTLKSFFGFKCKCERCSESEEMRAESDRRREEINRLDERVNDGRRIVQEPVEALHDVYKKLEIMKEERISDGFVARTYHDGFQIAVANGDLARAKVFAQRYYNETITCFGKDNPEADTSMALVKNPEKHGLYNKNGKWKQGVDKIPKDWSEEKFEEWLWKLPKGGLKA
ncbi:uncharacterized protein BCR38DRAFT_446010 [Pseudomassariella vexata]|uniref:SET domain-containing protein n=1 Tax=Pseudomassariella vexata TaxID=1141098 RepID=A0A1Y2DKH1_9PEZI|nr:uncharacterized protein BCR38DRAFT_446010 [Pseudomassariella vexata]ORY59255.1 hypothetical protein BCR38DRAFT_446010 [Pseudomassariella vexata]